MTNRNADSSQAEDGNLPPPPTGAPPPGTSDNRASRNGNKVYKSGPLFLSSRGIGWTSWKKRWFILTRTSLVFFRNDPSAIPQKGSEVNLTLGGIDLNSSGSVVVKADKKLLTVLFPDGRDGNGRAFTLKAETTEDLYEWKAALEEALANAPSAAIVMGQNGLFKSDQADAADGSLEQSKDRQPAKSLVIGRPILLALEDIDGTPSFLEKALRFVEEHGVKVEGILRQAADVDDVEHRIREYEEGKTDFSAEEDPHVIADCVKFVLRELPSSPVPASCCNALLEACRTDRSMRVSAMRTAICDTFPEPNRRLLQRILVMMQAVAANKVENRMSISAVAACMAPLLLRPLLAGDCELEHNFDMGGDGSVQLLQAAAAANHAQAIVITLLEEYENLFGEGDLSTELYTDTEESGSESEELSDDEAYEDDEDDEDASDGSDADMEEEIEGASSCTCSETGDSDDQHQHDKGSESLSSHSNSHEGDDDLDLEANQKVSCSPQRSRQYTDVEVIDDNPHQSKNSSTVPANDPAERAEDDNPEINSMPLPSESIQRSFTVANGPVPNSKRPTVWGRTGAKKNLSMENIDVPIEDEAEIQSLEDMKVNLQNKIAEEKKENAVLQEDLENQKNALHMRRLALEQDVAKLQEQLQNERELRAALEAGLKMPRDLASISASINERTKADLEEIAQAEADIISLKQKTEYLGMQVTQQREQNSAYVLKSSNQPQQTLNLGRVKEKEKDFESSVSSRSAEKSMRPKDTQVSKAQTEKDAKNQPPSLLSKPSDQNQQSDSLRDPKSAGTQAALASVEQEMGKSLITNSRRSGPRGETGPTSSALTKLTNRLNFLKERRNQIANELQTMDKGRNSGQAAQKQERGSKRSESPPSSISTDKHKESDGQSSEKERSGSDSNQGIDRGAVTEGSSFQNADTDRKLDIYSLQTRDRGIKQPEGQSTPNLDREKSESFPNNEKSRSVVPPRTFSR